MQKGVALLLLALLAIPLAYPIPIKELIAKFDFSASSAQMNISSYADFMIDKNGNSINDTLVLDLTTQNTNGNFIFVINLHDKNGDVVNETNKTLNAGENRINITFNSILLAQSQFSYSIKIYNSSRSLKYRKDNILTQNYSGYEEGFKIVGLQDERIGKELRLNVTLNSSLNGTFEALVFLSYNDSAIFLKENKTVADSSHDLIFNFGSEMLKRTHHTGNFNVYSIKIGPKLIKTNYATKFYDYRDFASTSYLSGFGDSGIDTDNDGKFDFLRISANAEIADEGYYTFILALYDLSDNLIDIINKSQYLPSGTSTIPFDINGSRIYNRRLDGTIAVKVVEMYDNETLADKIEDAYFTKNYKFNDFEGFNLPDLTIGILTSDGYHYGINNATANITLKNAGDKHAFNVFTDIFDNSTFSQLKILNILKSESEIVYSYEFINISDFEIVAIADLQNFVEEFNESNNAARTKIVLNKKPSLDPIENITIKETEKIMINISASDENGDTLAYSINSSKFLNNLSVFEWTTTNNDSGEYTFAATASDGFLNDSKTFRIVILDALDNDIDNDGINDTLDNLIGNAVSINTSMGNLVVLVNGSSNLSKIFSSNLSVRFLEGSVPLMDFPYDFSKHRLNLTNITINRQLPGEKGSMMVRGLKMPDKTLKSMYVDRANSSLNSVCVKDDQIKSISDISKKCNLKGEKKVKCNGKKYSTFRCTYDAVANRYKVYNLKHSGAVQILVK